MATIGIVVKTYAPKISSGMFAQIEKIENIITRFVALKFMIRLSWQSSLKSIEIAMFAPIESQSDRLGSFYSRNYT